MTDMIAFLRAVNVGGRMFPAADIRRVVAELGYADVATHINTGNVFLRTAEDPATVTAALERAFEADRGFVVPVMLFTADEYRVVVSAVAELDDPALHRHYVYLRSEPLDAETARRVEGLSDERGRMVVRGRSIHALLGEGYTPGEVDPLRAAKLLEPATNRNANTIRAIAGKWLA
ncbi:MULTISPECIES: DUF1697 domain-containing protein [Microbacterium]|uniref:DUF1697 domain-containing protein n=1 Tax=Microbacterium TaxID=33882 RepID=UPI001E30DFEB|nr:DUF1697 domain-containing protein [Microbacterium nymphoidis]MCD2499559.1 DUF1697 domain-containing protein [Microbacterium nymphoidis]